MLLFEINNFIFFIKSFFFNCFIIIISKLMTIAIEVMVGKIINRRFELKSVFQSIDFYSIYHTSSSTSPYSQIFRFSQNVKTFFYSLKYFFVGSNKIPTEEKRISEIFFPLNRNFAESAFLADKLSCLG